MIINVQAIAFMAALLVFLLGVTAFAAFFKPKQIKLLSRLTNTNENEMDDIEKEAETTTRYGKFHKTYISPQLTRHPNTLQRLSRMFGVNMAETDAKIKEARMSKTFSVEEVISMKILGFFGAMIFVSMAAAMNMNGALFVLGVASFLVGSILPQRMISSALKKRKDRIENTLPDFLDLVKSVAEAGLTIQDALNKVTIRMRGPLAEEFQSVMVETKASGGEWRTAMENMAFRNDVEVLSDVVSDILIAYEKGTSIVDTLEKEATSMRQFKNSRIQEKSKAMSVKLIIPMAIFSFLPLLVLLIAPMMMQMMTQMQ